MPLLLLVCFGLRAWITAINVLAWGDCGSCLVAASIRHDLGLLALFALLSAAWMMLPRWLAWAALAVQGLLLLAIVADLVTLASFSLRLSLRDVLKFGQELSAVFGYTFTRLLSTSGLIALAGLLALLAAWWGSARVLRKRSPLGVGLTAVIAVVSLVAWLLPGRAWHPLPWTYRNLLEVNWPSGVDRAYSEGARQRLRALPAPPSECRAGQGRGHDLVVVLIESWSWYHLAELGVMDATPGLDRLRAEGASWTRFFANGFTTDHGLIALLGGVTPLPSVNRYRSLDAFSGYGDLPGSLPRRLGEDGYRSLFFTSGDLGFLGKGDWLRSIGFDHAEGSEAAFYDGLPRFAFGAAHDGHLFDRVLDWLDWERDAGQPFVAVVETVTTHPPFEHPETGVQDEAGAFQFVDAQVVRFVDQLRARGFFDNGLLVVTSDQRALAPLRRQELDRFGDAAPALLPFMVLGPGFDDGRENDTTAQMQDFPASVDALLTPGACAPGDAGDLFATPPRPPRCVLHPQGNQREVVEAWCMAGRARILLDGDATRLLEGDFPEAQRLIEKVNRQRVLQGELAADLATIL